jgi:hypothetical protein
MCRNFTYEVVGQRRKLKAILKILVRCPSVKKRNHVRQICLEGKNFMEDSPQLQVPDIVFCNAVDPCVLFKTLQKTNRMREASLL